MLFLGSLLSIVVKCKGYHTNQRNIVAAFMKFLDPYYPEDDNEMSTNLAGGKKNPGDYVMQGVAELTPKEYPKMVDYFTNKVIPLIKENDRLIVTTAIYLLINEDTEIDDETVVEIISGIKKKDLVIAPECLASYLAGVFLYTLKNTSNIQKSGFAKQEAEKYVKLAKDKCVPTFEKRKDNTRLKTTTTERVRLFKGDHYSPIGVAILLQKWNEKNQFDIVCIEFLTGKTYIDVYEDLRLENEVSINHEGRVVSCFSEPILRDQLVEGIDEEHVNKLFSSIRIAITKCSVFEVIDGIALRNICDFLAFMGCNIRLSLRVDENRWNNLVFEWVCEIIKNVRLIECFANSFPVIVEANPIMFLEAIEAQICDDCIEKEKILGWDEPKVAYPVACALRKTAAYRGCFAGAMSVLFELSKHSNVFFENMRCVFVPSYPQTEAFLLNRIGVLKSFFMQDDDMAWKLLISILPGSGQITSRRLEFRYYPIQIQDVSQEEYGQAVEQYVKLACTKIDHIVDRAQDLIRVCPILPDALVDVIVEAVIEEIPASDNTVELLNMIEQYQGDFISDEGKRNAFSKLQKQYAANQDEVSVRKVFTACKDKRSESMKLRAETIILSKYKKEGFEGLIDGFAKLEDIYYYGKVIRKVLKEDEFRKLCYYLAERNLCSGILNL